MPKKTRVMVLVKATESSERGFVPDEWTAAMLAAMGKFNDELRRANILIQAEGLKPSSHGARIAFDGATRKVINGPFAATNDLVAGYWLWEVRDMAEAIFWAQRCPNPMPEYCEIEIRPLYEAADLQ